MKKKALLLAGFLGVVSVWALAPAPPPGTISQPRRENTAAAAPATSAQGNLAVTNTAGGTYSVNQLATQLENLRANIEQTLPMLTAFTQTYSNSAAAGTPQSVENRLSGLLSGVINRGNNAANNAPQPASGATNILSVLEGLLNKGQTNTAPVNASTLQDLVALQNHLQPAIPILDRLTANGASGAATATNSFHTPAPTGR